MGNILFIAFLLVVGYSLKFLKLPSDFGKSLNLFIIYISLPATVLLMIPQIELNSDLLILSLLPWILIIPMAFFAIYLTRGMDKNIRASLLLLLPLGNTSFVGIPLIEALIGKVATPYALVYDQFGTFLMLSIYGTSVIAYYQHGKVDVLLIAKKIVTFPAFIALVFALFFGEMPKPMIPYIENLSNTLVPLAIIAVGFALKIKVESHKKIFSQAIAIKMLITPILAFLILSLFDVEKIVFDVAILESAMPFMITATALAINAGFAPQFSASLLGYSIVISLFSIPALYMLLGNF